MTMGDILIVFKTQEDQYLPCKMRCSSQEEPKTVSNWEWNGTITSGYVKNSYGTIHT